jgi:hypothetical protein
MKITVHWDPDDGTDNLIPMKVVHTSRGRFLVEVDSPGLVECDCTQFEGTHYFNQHKHKSEWPDDQYARS